MAQDTSSSKPAKRSSPVKNGYLILYNAVSAGLWATVLARTVEAIVQGGPEAVYPATGDFVLWTQTLMILDVLHGLFGVVRSDPVTAGLQVASRYVAVWAVQYMFPSLCSSPIYSSMLLAWSMTEVLRYGYLALKLAGWEPYALFYIRYSSYRVLYPVGILSEMGMMYLALAPAMEQIGQWYQVFLGACLFVIWPAGAYILIGHMNRQRRKVLKAAKAQNVKATQ
ncbi:tyrosine phosphatase-like protein [Xylariales sp. PMI_506]|nr:tyrosine phosphatase-like protein [Xylariales sp. PMI_506]